MSLAFTEVARYLRSSLGTIAPDRGDIRVAKRRKKKSGFVWTLTLAVLVLLFLREFVNSTSDSVKDGDSDKVRRQTQEQTTSEKTERNSREQRETSRDPSTPTLSVDERDNDLSKFHDFDAAKGVLRKLFSRGRDFYCDCSYDFTRKPHVDPSSCGLKSKSDRAKRIEWEHVVPASYYGRQFSAWTKGDPECRGKERKGRECARKVSREFQRMEGDLYNLVPAVGELNRVRGNNSFGEIPGEPREYGACDFETLANKTEPKADIRGDIARIYFYMDARYPEFAIVNEENQNLFEEWSLADPIDDKERERVRKIEAAQGNSFFIGRLAKTDKSSRIGSEAAQRSE